MSFATVAASGVDDLLNQLYTFATVTDGTWTGHYNVDPGQRQIALSNGNCFVALGSRAADLNIARSPSGTDSIMSMALSSSINGGNQVYWGHPDSIVTTDNDPQRVRTNDLAETYNNVFFYSDDSTYIHCVVQVSSQRFTHFGFGEIDNLGQTHSPCAFAIGTYHEWWPDGIDSNNPGDSVHSIGHFGENNLNFYVPNASVLPAGYPALGGSGSVFFGDQMNVGMTRVQTPNLHYASSAGKPLDFFHAIDNQNVTGGIALYGLPMLFMETTSGISHVWLGNIPGVKLVNIRNLAPADTITQGAQTFAVFPLKRKGLQDEALGGANQQPEANTVDYALAYERIS